MVIEALSFGLPVACLDLGGPSSFVNASCGVIVPAHDASEREGLEALAKALLDIFPDPVRHRTLCRAALLRVVSLTWEKKIQRVMTLIRVRLGR